jgi:hypothetical protein
MYEHSQPGTLIRVGTDEPEILASVINDLIAVLG